MTNQEIEAFLAVVRYGTLSKAAERIHISQPALSKRIASLEEELYCPLILRKKGIRTVSLTEAGSAFVPVANKWKELWQESKEVLTRKKRQNFSMAATDGPYLYVFAEALQQLHCLHEELNFQLRTLNFADAYRMVEKGGVDLAFVGVNYYYRALHVVPAYRERMYFLCRADAPFGETVHPTELSAEKCIFSGYSGGLYQWFERWFHEKKPLVETDLVAQVELFLSQGETDCWTIAPASVAAYLSQKPQFALRKLEKSPKDRIVYCVTRNDFASSFQEDFFALLRHQMADMEGMEWLIPIEKTVK